MSPIFRGKWGHKLANLVIHVFDIEKVNWVYGRSCQFTGAAFANSLLNDLGVQYLIGNAERLRQLPEGAFITVSNHPYGGLDGVMLIDLMAGIRSDYKLMVNQLLSYVKTMDDHFISVKPKVGKKSTDPVAGVNGIRETLTNLHEGHPVGFFPAGAVSMFSFRRLRVSDREWQESIIKLIQRANVPVLPIRFFDQNSPFFYFLGTIDWRIRLIRMPYELFNKDRHPHHIGIGSLLPADEIASFKNARSLGDFLKQTVYTMPRPTTFIPRNALTLPNHTL